MEIFQAQSAEQIAQARVLFEEYAADLGVDLCFQGFEAELAGLPGAYAPPNGRLLLAVQHDEVAGCIALRALEDSVCEMKRLFLRPAFRGQGLGLRLVRAAIDEARRIGYRAMRLDTLPTMAAAAALYHSLGFRTIPAYRHNPVPGTLYMELRLDNAKGES